MTAAFVEEVAARHDPTVVEGQHLRYCEECGQRTPCDALQLARMLMQQQDDPHPVPLIADPEMIDVETKGNPTR